MKVLIVDDSKSIRLLIKGYIVDSGHQAVLAENGVQALEILKETFFDLILMDVEMPKLNGYETTKIIREKYKEDWFPILFLSSNSEDEYIEKGVRAGGDAYLTKPISHIKLQAQIDAMARIAQMRHELHDTNSKMKSIFESVVDGILIIDERGTITSANNSVQNIFGYTCTELIGKNVCTLMPESFSKNHNSYINNYLNTGVKKIIGIGREVQGKHKNGITFPLELSISDVITDDGRLFVGLARDISERKIQEQQLQEAVSKLANANIELEKLSYFDGLTHIANRRQFDRRLTEELRRAQREKKPLSLILSDIDYFKKFNDTCGHQAGDSCLKRVATVISRCLLRSADLPARYGGEEFAIILPNTDRKGAIVVAEKIRTSLWQENLPHSASQIADRVTLSLGVSTIEPGDDITKEELVETADNALYHAKKKGRNRVETALAVETVE